MISGIRAYRRHLRVLGTCGKGARKWWADRGWSWDAFIDHGIPVEALEETEDTQAIAVAWCAREEAAEASRA